MIKTIPAWITFTSGTLTNSGDTSTKLQQVPYGKRMTLTGIFAQPSSLAGSFKWSVKISSFTKGW